MKRWKRTPLLSVSVLVHVAAIGWLLADPDRWPAVLAVLVGNHLLLAAATLSPRGQWLGPNMARCERAAARGEICLTFDDGPDPNVTPRVLDLLDHYGAKASFFCIGCRAAAHPDLVIEIARRGHSIENHSHTHSNLFAFYGPGRMRREVDLAQATMRQITGRAPQFFRAPAGFRNPLLDPLLVSRGLRYVSWTRRGYDGVSNNAGRIRDRLIRGLAAGDVLLLHDSRRIVLDVLPHVLEEVKRKRWRCVTLPAACGDDGAEERMTSAHAVHG